MLYEQCILGRCDLFERANWVTRLPQLSDIVIRHHACIQIEMQFTTRRPQTTIASLKSSPPRETGVCAHRPSSHDESLTATRDGRHETVRRPQFLPTFTLCHPSS